MTINREHFEAWLFSQPKHRVMKYTQGLSREVPGCLLCNYLRENFRLSSFVVGTNFIWLNYTQDALPNWFRETMRKFENRQRYVPTFTIGEAQAEYLKLFPDTVVSNFETNPAPVTDPAPEEKEAA